MELDDMLFRNFSRKSLNFYTQLMNRAMTNTIDTHANDYNAQHGKTCSQRIVGELSR